MSKRRQPEDVGAVQGGRDHTARLPRRGRNHGGGARHRGSRSVPDRAEAALAATIERPPGTGLPPGYYPPTSTGLTGEADLVVRDTMRIDPPAQSRRTSTRRRWATASTRTARSERRQRLRLRDRRRGRERARRREVLPRPVRS